MERPTPAHVPLAVGVGGDVGPVVADGLAELEHGLGDLRPQRFADPS